MPISSTKPWRCSDREIQFLPAYLGAIEPLEQGWPALLLSRGSASGRSVSVRQGFRLGARRRCSTKRSRSSAQRLPSRWSGAVDRRQAPTRAARRPSARMFGQLHFPARPGCPVPGVEAKLFLADRIWRSISNVRRMPSPTCARQAGGRAEHLYETIERWLTTAAVILNEIFNSDQPARPDSSAARC